jgi:3-deoxy-D-manno-octulosonic-acid transferase
LPEAEIVFSTTTDTGYARAIDLYGAKSVFRFPLDFSWVIARVLRMISPSMIVLVELEVWYNLVRLATRRGIPVAVVNGRLTAKSFRRLSRLGPFVRSMFADLAWVGAQDDTIASRFRRLGAREDRVEVTSSLKWDSATVADSVEGDETLARELGIPSTRPLWVCGSTGPGEEAMVLDAYQKLLDQLPTLARDVHDAPSEDVRPLLALVPRKPERFDEVARLIERAGFACLRRSTGTAEVAATMGTDSFVVLGDTMGELRKFYALASVVFVGRTLVPLGGSDPMEVAALGKPVVIGPHFDNFELPVRALREADAIREVDSADTLPGAISAILGDAALADGLGARARDVVLRNQGATQRTAEGLSRALRGEARHGVQPV